MSGRFFSAALLASVVLLSQFEIKSPKIYWPVLRPFCLLEYFPFISSRNETPRMDLSAMTGRSSWITITSPMSAASIMILWD